LGECLGVPIFRAPLLGGSLSTESDYAPTAGDEVEDLYSLVSQAVAATGATAVSCGAILSDYQRVRVEGVASRLGITSLAYLWRRDQTELLEEITSSINAVLIKVAALGLKARHAGMPLADAKGDLLRLHAMYGIHPCGEGGEYETIVVDAPCFKKRIVIDSARTVSDKDQAFYYVVDQFHLEEKSKL
jgi:diphthine-ammonia ligase